MDLRQLTVGWQQFKREQFEQNRSFLAGLATGDQPKPLAVVACVDPRLNLPWITSQRAGLISQHQTMGGIIPPWGAHSLSEESYFEFALNRFKVDHIVVMGHTECRMVQALLGPKEDLLKVGRATFKWGMQARDTAPTVERVLKGLQGQERARAAIEVHTLLQVQHMMTYQIVQDAIKDGKLQVHPVVYDIGAADLYEYSEQQGKFELLSHRYGEHQKQHAGTHVCGPNCLHNI